jgi:hypothetical protein
MGGYRLGESASCMLTCCATVSESAGMASACVVQSVTAAAAASGRLCLERESRKKRNASSAYLKASEAPCASSPQCCGQYRGGA